MSDLEHTTLDTKPRILQLAIQLFAQKGPDAVGIREIAAAANVSLNTVMYHFKSKENLYNQTLLYVLSQIRNQDSIIAKNKPHDPSDPLQVANAIANTFNDFMMDLIQDHKMQFVDLLARAIYSQQPAAQQIILDVPDTIPQLLFDYIKPAAPNTNLGEIHFLINIFWTQAILYISGRTLINIKNQRPVDSQIPAIAYKHAAFQLSILFCRHINLPDPQKSDELQSTSYTAEQGPFSNTNINTQAQTSVI
ncbi:TetR/AcrR family transcriptional regulator [Planctomycetota bacterium]|nr:TetR/AcrR family transcriptional regulator [Planctomycetota bacterium]